MKNSSEQIINEEIIRVYEYTGGVQVVLSDNERNVVLGAMKSNAIKFAEWLRTFEALEKKDGQWVIESQVSTEELYAVFKLSDE